MLRYLPRGRPAGSGPSPSGKSRPSLRSALSRSSFSRKASCTRPARVAWMWPWRRRNHTALRASWLTAAGSLTTLRRSFFAAASGGAAQQRGGHRGVLLSGAPAGLVVVDRQVVGGGLGQAHAVVDHG